MLEVAVTEYNGTHAYDEMIRARDALQHETYYCPYCGVKVLRKNHSNGNVFFARFPGEPLHQNRICRFIVNGNYSFDEFDIDAFFAGIFKETQQKSPPSGGSGGPSRVDVPGGSQFGVHNIETKGEGGIDQFGGDEQGDDGQCSGLLGESPDESELAVDIPKKKITSLANLYKCDLHNSPPDMMLGQYKLSDVLISKQRRAAKLLFEDDFAGERVIQAWPESLYNSQKYGLIFRCAYHDGNQWNNKRLVLLFGYSKKKDFKKEYDKIWKRVTKDTGVTKRESNAETVFLAGDWERVDKPQCASWCNQTKRCENCSGLYKAQFRSPNQLYRVKKKS